MDKALREALCDFYPNINEMRLLDFKVRVLSALTSDEAGTASNVRVLAESGDATRRWVTTGVSHNVIEASWQALEDSINYKLFIDDKAKLVITSYSIHYTKLYESSTACPRPTPSCTRAGPDASSSSAVRPA